MQEEQIVAVSVKQLCVSHICHEPVDAFLANPHPMSGVIQREMTWMSKCRGRREEAVARTLVLSPMPENSYLDGNARDDS